MFAGIFKELLKFKNKKNSSFKMFKRYKWILYKKRYTKVNKHKKGCLASLVIREIQIKTTNRTTLHPLE